MKDAAQAETAEVPPTTMMFLTFLVLYQVLGHLGELVFGGQQDGGVQETGQDALARELRAHAASTLHFRMLPSAAFTQSDTRPDP